MNPVASGVDVLQRNDFLKLHGLRLGLITNHTGLNREGKATADLLRNAPGIQLMTLFGPEHGIRGTLDTRIQDEIDPQTGLPVFSLFGQRNRPTPEQLADLNALAFDMQDIGTRFYTYISTLGYCMEEAAKHKMLFFVLDRPNPIGGTEVEGPLADQFSFTAYHSLPIRHGMTVGELARMFQTEKNLTLDLQVVPVEGWRRDMLWDATNLTWVNPSPNMRSLHQALLYPGIGLLETTNVSVGRGTDTPFEVVGAPWIKGRQLCHALNTRELPGIRFVPIRFTPTSSTHAARPCEGVHILITERHRVVPVFTGITIAATLRDLYPNAWEIAGFNRLLAHEATLRALRDGASPQTLVTSWQSDIETFRRRRAPYLLYPNTIV